MSLLLPTSSNTSPTRNRCSGSCRRCVRITVRDQFPAHTGLGSGSQIALATARAISKLYGKPLPGHDACPVDRSRRNIGNRHGCIRSRGVHHRRRPHVWIGPDKTDFRPSSASRGIRPAAVTVRHEFPPDWGILLVVPDLPAGANGSASSTSSGSSARSRFQRCRSLCHEVLMRMLPGIAEQDLDLFGSSINAVQGLGFKKVEIGLQPQEIPGLLDVLRQAGAARSGHEFVWAYPLRGLRYRHARS